MHHQDSMRMQHSRLQGHERVDGLACQLICCAHDCRTITIRRRRPYIQTKNGLTGGLCHASVRDKRRLDLCGRQPVTGDVDDILRDGAR